jgi:hypothetical protein
MSIVNDELLSQNVELRKKLGNSEELNDVGHKFYMLSSSPNLVIYGVALSEGIWKGVFYPYEVLKASLSKFKNIPILVGHGKTAKYGDRKVGVVTDVNCDDNLKAITFKGNVSDPEAVEDVKNAIYDAVSPFGLPDKIEINKDGKTSICGYNPNELSLTNTPACKRCLIFSVNELSNAFKDATLNSNDEAKLMSENTFPPTEKTNTDAKTTPESTPISNKTEAPAPPQVSKEESKEKKELPIQTPPQEVKIKIEIEQKQPPPEEKKVEPPKPDVSEEKKEAPKDPPKEEAPPKIYTPNEIVDMAKKDNKLVDLAVDSIMKDTKGRKKQ